MTKKQQYLNELNAYVKYAKETNVHQKPTKGINSGAHGRAYEWSLKATFNLRSKVASAGHADMRKQVDGIFKQFEIKQGCGELATLDENGDIIKTVFTKDYIITSPDYLAGDNVLKVSYILTAENYLKVLTLGGLIRKKKSTYALKNGLNYCDRLAIQSYKNSKKKEALFWDLLEEYGEPLEKWALEKGLIK